MSRNGLLVLLVVLVSGALYAGAQSDNQKLQILPSKPELWNENKPPSSDTPEALARRLLEMQQQLRAGNSWKILPDTPALGLPGETGGTCFKMRTYQAQQDTPDSDSTHISGYTECHPGSKLKLKLTPGN